MISYGRITLRVTINSKRFFHHSSVVFKSHELALESPQGDGDATGVVFLFGWTGCKVKSLQKYVDIYTKKGETVIKYCPSPSLIYGVNPRAEYRQITKKIQTLLLENDLQEKPMFFHSFSNGGTYMYNALTKDLIASKCKASIRGTIFDSTPAKTGYQLLKGSVSQVAPGNALVKNACGILGVIWCYSLLGYNYLLDTVSMRDLRKTEDYRYYLHRSLIGQPNLGPQMCLFSKSDQVTSYQDVLSFIDGRIKRGVPIKYRMFDNSKHVKHLLDYPDEYLSLVDNFFEECKSNKYLVHNGELELTPKLVPVNNPVFNIK